VPYFAVHAFELAGPGGGRRWARLDWEPVAGVRVAPKDTSPDRAAALRAEVGTPLARLILRAQLADPGDDPGNPTRAWSRNRPRIVLGQLQLTAVAPDPVDALSFDPARLPAGLTGCPDDQIFQARCLIYGRSFARRGARPAGS
jgi:catalase